ncbi:ADP-ribosylglycohydrolase family protein [Liberiplasma polymorphum]|uniref:ADP-ribosylglycohydrolase family protein n=1 Tax=Liberiplasma polymorphum TaxID=3374570 RepID=UPI003770DA5F
MEKYLKGALVSNSASLGLNWIYDMPYLEKLAEKEYVLFQKEDPLKYQEAKKSFYSYPHADIGDVSFQGNILKWLYTALKENPELTKEAYQDLVYEHIKPAGDYVGYAEFYGRKLVANKLNELLKSEQAPYTYNDDQLVGFVPYLVCKELGLSKEKTWSLAQAFTNVETFKDLYSFFDTLLENVAKFPLKEALEKAVTLLPKGYLEKGKKAIEVSDTKTFILNHANTACHIDHAVPLIIHIMYHTTSFEDAVTLNTIIGGASSDRGLLLGALLSQIYRVPSDWVNKVNIK